MDKEERQEALAVAVEKYEAGEKLTDKEWVLIAYGWTYSGCSSCGRQ